MDVNRKLDVPYQPHSAASREAAETVKPVVKTLEQEVLTIIQLAGNDGRTDEEIYYELGMTSGSVQRLFTKESTVRARRVRLVELGKVSPAKSIGGDLTYTRRTRSGRNAQVWVAA